MTARSWRAMQETDLDRVTEISDVVHRDYRESRAVYAERLKLYPAGCRVLDCDGIVQGFIVAHPWYRDASPKLNAMLGALPENARSFYLHDIALLPETRGSGAGRVATAFVIDHARAAGFEDVTLIAVNGADSYWSLQGFREVQASEDGTPLPSYGDGTVFMRQLV